jgi:GNAT superfamily N-acetyltransferase
MRSSVTDAAAVSIAAAHPDEPDARALIEELGVLLLASTGRFGATTFGAKDLEVARSKFVIARASDGSAVGCGAIRLLTRDVVELKRMYARPGTRGVGAAILAHLEGVARDWGYTDIWLETGTTADRAIAFYERNGYTVIPNFGEYAGHDDSICFGKRLGPIHGDGPAHE